MGDKDLLLKEKLDYTGLVDFSGFYSYAYGWLKYEEYSTTEDEYSEKVSGGEREITVKWSAVKPISDYFKIEHKIRIDIKGMTDVEVEINGKKKKMNKGKVTVDIKSSIIKDPNNDWAGDGWKKFIRETYDKYIIPGRIEGMEEKIKGDARSFKEDLKTYLELSGKR